MKKILLVTLGLFVTLFARTVTTYTIDIDQPEKEILRGHLDLGGSNPSGDEYAVNSYFIEKNGTPFVPIVGEIHFSRYPEAYWEESLLKMKAGGINVVASYVFWNIHERKEGVFDWSGNLNLRKFVQLAAKHELAVIVRMGPFCHGEMRNGGIPDWLYGRPFEVRSNDPEYLKYVDVLYGEIAKQIKGLLFENGGPVIGVQLENEYQHSAAPWEYSYPDITKELTVADLDASLVHEQIAATDGQNPWLTYGNKHMKQLKALAKKHGINVPLYTATGWGNATIVEKASLPVTAGYAYPFWQDPTPSPFYLFKDIHAFPDYSPVSFDATLYPSIPAEIGPGIQVKHSRRPIVPAESVAPMMVRILGSGSNGIGYYMYHGGSTPQFDGKYYNEEANGIPRINYDFQAPIGQYGQTREHYKSLRRLHAFLTECGSTLAPMKTVLPTTNASIQPEDTQTLRYAVRSKGNSGFLFLINYQDHIDVQPIENVRIDINAKGESFSFPAKGSMNLPVGTHAILPFNRQIGSAWIRTATVQPFAILHRKKESYYVFAGIQGVESELVFPQGTKLTRLQNARVYKEGKTVRVRALDNEPVIFSANGTPVVVLPYEMSLNAVKMNETLLITEGLLLENKDQMRLISRKVANDLLVFPAEEVVLSNERTELIKQKSPYRGFASYCIRFHEEKPEIEITKVSERKYTLRLLSDVSKWNDVFVQIDYVGDRAMAFIHGIMITDHFYHEKRWEIGLKSFVEPLAHDAMLLFFHPMESGSRYLSDLKHVPVFENGQHLEVKGFDIVPEYAVDLQLK